MGARLLLIRRQPVLEKVSHVGAAGHLRYTSDRPAATAPVRGTPSL